MVATEVCIVTTISSDACLNSMRGSSLESRTWILKLSAKFLGSMRTLYNAGEIARSSRFSYFIQIWLGSLEKASLRISEKDIARCLALAAKMEFFWIMVYWVPVHAIRDRRALAL